ncbi:MAG: hypothetical protein ABR513_06200, partial [Desulfotignum sp.]
MTKNMIVTGLAVFVLAVLSPFWFNLVTTTQAAPEPELLGRAKEAKKCVLDKYDNFAATDAHGPAAASRVKNEAALHAERWGMVIDIKKIDDKLAKKITRACHSHHNVPDFNHEVDEQLFPDTRPVNHTQDI